MKNITPFQMIFLALFSILFFFGVFVLSTYQVNDVPAEEQIGTVTIWGTYDARIINAWLQDIKDTNENYRGISYREFSKGDFNTELLEAMAENRSPDLLLLDNTELYQQSNRIIQLTPDLKTKTSFRSEFLEASEIYFTDDAILGVPLLIDPMVMYWNRSMFSNEGYVSPPKIWKDFFKLSKVFTRSDPATLTISQTVIPFGEARNVRHNRDILSTLILQSGNPVVSPTNESGYRGSLSGTETYPSAAPALDFYTEFSNPTSEYYSWNRALPSSDDYFLAGKSAVYFGFASEVKTLQLKNPNLNFDVAEVPQSESTDNKAVYARVYGLFIPRATSNPNGAFIAMNVLTGTDSSRLLSEITKLASPRRDVAAMATQDKELFTEIFKKQAIIARSYINPSDVQTQKIFGDMIENVTSGLRSSSEAAMFANTELTALFAK